MGLLRPWARPSRLLLLLLVFAGCGGGTPEAPVGFVNQTQHSDADLWAIWQQAQQSLATRIDLNPLQQTESGAPTQLLPGDARALTVQPHQLLVTPQADVSSAALAAATGVQRPDPTGLIACPQSCNVRFAPAFSSYDLPQTRYAQSWEGAGDNFLTLLQYEFENHILNALGYDTTWR
jgi:hypothetical protein